MKQGSFKGLRKLYYYLEASFCLIGELNCMLSAQEFYLYPVSLMQLTGVIVDTPPVKAFLPWWI